MSAEARLKEKNIILPKTTSPLANYVGAVRTGNLLFVSGHGPIRDGKATSQGKVGKDLTVEQGYQVAREVGLALLAVVRAELGSLDRGWVELVKDAGHGQRDAGFQGATPGVYGFRS